jgi:hypothetical protein
MFENWKITIKNNERCAFIQYCSEVICREQRNEKNSIIISMKIIEDEVSSMSID